MILLKGSDYYRKLREDYKYNSKHGNYVNKEMKYANDFTTVLAGKISIEKNFYKQNREHNMALQKPKYVRKEGRGTSFLSESKTNENAPDFKGSFCLDGKEGRISSWIEKDKNGNDKLSHQIQWAIDKPIVNSNNPPEHEEGEVGVADPNSPF